AGLVRVGNFEEAAVQASALAEKRNPEELVPAQTEEKLKKIAEGEYERFGCGQKYLRGLYSGGALCTEAMTIIKKALATVYSNVPLEHRLRLPDPHSSKGHACVDFGADDLSDGKHPSVNLVPRCERFLREAKDWEAAVVVFDVILGNGAHPDPAGELARTVREARNTAENLGGYLSSVASIVGTPGDPQNFRKQREQLESAGVVVLSSNAQAARVATAIATSGRAWKKLTKQ
ncbi:MAG: FdrA family protein, partial [Methanobacteriota archaeon]